MRWKLLVLAASCCLPIGASRAADPLAPPDLARYLRWGPLRVRPGFAIPALGYDDNVFTTGEPQGDYMTRLSPRVEGVVLFGRSAFLTFKEELYYTLYASHDELNHFENMGSARVTFPLRRIGFFVDGALNRLKDPPASEVSSRPIRREHRLGAGAILKLGWRTDAELQLVRSDWTTDDPYVAPDGFTAAQLLNRTETGTQVKLRYRLTGTTRVGVDTLRRRIVFDEPAVERDSHETSVLPVVEFGEGGRLFGNVRIGWDRLEPTTPGEPDFSGMVGDAKIAYRFAGTMTLRVEGLRRAGFALYNGNRYYQEGAYNVRLVRYLNRIFGVEVLGGEGHLFYPAASTATARTDHDWRAGTALRVRLPESVLGRRAEYSLGIVHTRRDSSDSTLSFSRNVFGISADIGF